VQYVSYVQSLVTNGAICKLCAESGNKWCSTCKCNSVQDFHGRNSVL